MAGVSEDGGDTEPLGSVEDEGGVSLLVDVGFAGSVAFCVGSTKLGISLTTPLTAEVTIDIRESVGSGLGYSWLELVVTIPVGASRISLVDVVGLGSPLETGGTTGGEDTGAVGNGDSVISVFDGEGTVSETGALSVEVVVGLGAMGEPEVELVDGAAGGSSEGLALGLVVGRTIVEGMPPVEPTTSDVGKTSELDGK